ncbi:hypothetical protein [Propionibacterium acidifaciens]|uniref:hypothetical protein n=1 Tax=Propionibacterium acidifaciens TaxID=556499 RepID=UPI0028EB797D|nr:hypothetical protein [Propionibacterium acidifaciens]
MAETMAQLNMVHAAWKQRRVSISNLALILDQILGTMRDKLSDETYREALGIWGNIEIINATLLDEDRAPTAEESGDADKFFDELYSLLQTSVNLE